MQRADYLMKNITMFDNVEGLKKSIKNFRLVSNYEYFNVLVKMGKSYHVVTIQYDIYEDEFWINHPSYNFSLADIEQYAILSKE